MANSDQDIGSGSAFLVRTGVEPCDAASMVALASFFEATASSRGTESCCLDMVRVSKLDVKYPEVTVLTRLLHLRIACRNALESIMKQQSASKDSTVATEDTESPSSRWKAIHDGLGQVANVLCDSVFLHMQSIITQQWLSESSNMLDKSSRVIDTQRAFIFDVHEATVRLQNEILRETMHLTQRCARLTFAFHASFPFCCTE